MPHSTVQFTNLADLLVAGSPVGSPTEPRVARSSTLIVGCDRVGRRGSCRARNVGIDHRNRWDCITRHIHVCSLRTLAYSFQWGLRRIRRRGTHEAQDQRVTKEGP